MDTIDQSVLSCLLADARATYAEIGDVVGLSAPAVKRRVDRLRETGAIRGFTALVDPAALGCHLRVVGGRFAGHDVAARRGSFQSDRGKWQV